MGGIEVVDPRYPPILERARALFAADERVVRVEVGGSIGDGEADAFSDLDIHVYTRPEDRDAVVAEWPEWLPKIAETVFARTPVLPFIINTVTVDGLTLDVVVFPEGTPKFVRPSGYPVGQISLLRYDDHPAAVEYAVAETLRCIAGPFCTDWGRDEPLRSLTGVGHFVGLLQAVMLAEIDGEPPNPKRPSASLNEEQRACLAALPPLHASRDSVSVFNLTVAAEVLRRARPLFDKYGIAWPDAFEATARRRLHEVTGLTWT